MKTSTKLWLALGVLVVLTPLGLLAKGTAWGEWTSTQLSNRHGVVPEGLVRLEQLWTAIFAGYKIPGWTDGWRGAVGYVCSAMLGCGIVAGGALLLSKWLTARKPKR